MAKNRSSGVTNKQGNLKKWRETIQEAKTNDELSEFLKKEFSIQTGLAFDKLDLDAAKLYVDSFADMVNEFPGLEDQIVRFGNTEKNAYASMSSNGHLSLNPDELKSLEAARKTYARDVKSGFHPAGTDVQHIITHELGHALEAMILKKTYQPGTPEFSNAWRECTVASEIVTAAANKAVSGYDKNPSKLRDAIIGISRYAAHDSSETMAEAVSDYRANGSKAKPLSRAIWAEIKNRLS